MESLPLELLENELMLRLDAQGLSDYCALSRSHKRMCQSKNFWKAKVATTSRRELQDDYFIFFAKQGEIRLLWRLYEEISRQHIEIDSFAITYAALYLLEQKDTLSQSGREFLDLLVAHSESDRNIHHSFSSPEKYLVRLDKMVGYIKRSLELEHYDDLADNPQFISRFYISDYTNDYIYDKVKDMLPPVKDYFDSLITKFHAKTDYFMLGMIGAEARKGEIAKLQSTLNYARTNKYLNHNPNFKPPRSLGSWYYEATSKCIEELPYHQAKKLLNEDDLWRIAVEARISPTDPATYYHLARVLLENPRLYKDSLILANGYRSLEPQEFIHFINSFVKTKLDAIAAKEIMEEAKVLAEQQGYTYFSSVLHDELKAPIKA